MSITLMPKDIIKDFEKNGLPFKTYFVCGRRGQQLAYPQKTINKVLSRMKRDHLYFCRAVGHVDYGEVLLKRWSA